MERLADQHRATDLKYGLALAPLKEGGYGKSSRFCAIGSFVSWALREVEICRKLGIGYHVPLLSASPILAYVALVVIRRCCLEPGGMVFPMEY